MESTSVPEFYVYVIFNGIIHFKVNRSLPELTQSVNLIKKYRQFFNFSGISFLIRFDTILNQTQNHSKMYEV